MAECALGRHAHEVAPNGAPPGATQWLRRSWVRPRQSCDRPRSGSDASAGDRLVPVVEADDLRDLVTADGQHLPTAGQFLRSPDVGDGEADYDAPLPREDLLDGGPHTPVPGGAIPGEHLAPIATAPLGFVGRPPAHVIGEKVAVGAEITRLQR